jgi:methylated-DNA-protein-cysteine methyltransferase-like protein
MPTLPPEHERLYSRIYAVVRQIPAGKVATYGQIAEIVGDCTARVVGYAMAASPDDVPWQRVINAQGKVSPRSDSWGTEVQRLRLQEEGIAFDADHKVNLPAVRWAGPSLEWRLEHGFTPPADAPASPGGPYAEDGEDGEDGEDDMQPRLL